MEGVAVEYLERCKVEAYERYQREVQELDEAIASLRNGSVPKNGHAHPAIQANQWATMKAADALWQYLNERGGGPIDIKQVVRDLRTAGVEPDWQVARYERNLKIMIANNLKKFRYAGQGGSMVEKVGTRKKLE